MNGKRRTYKEELLTDLTPTLMTTGHISFHSRTITSRPNDGDVVLTVKNEQIPDFNGLLNGTVLRSAIKTFKYPNFTLTIGKEKKSDITCLILKKKQLSMNLYLKKYEEQSLKSLYMDDIDWHKCPTDFFDGLHQVTKLSSSNSFLHEKMIIQGETYYLSMHSIVACRYRLASPLPFKLNIELCHLKRIPANVRKKPVFRIGRLSHDGVEGVVFDFKKHRLFIPDFPGKEFVPENLEVKTVDFEIKEDLMKARDFYQHNRRNVLPIQGLFKRPCDVLIELPKDIRKRLRSFTTIEFVTFTINKNTLVFQAEDEYLTLTEKCCVERYGAGMEASFTVRSENLYEAVNGNCLIGFCCTPEYDGSRIYIKTNKLEYMIPAIQNGGMYE